MLALDGINISGQLWSGLRVQEVLIEYDGPKASIALSGTGQLFLIWWCDSEDAVDRWACVPVSQNRLARILSGNMPVAEALKNPEDGYLYIVDSVGGDANNTYLVSGSAFPTEYSPSVNATVVSEQPGIVAGLASVTAASRENLANVLDIHLNPSGTTRHGEIPVRFVTNAVGYLQKSLDAIGQALFGTPTVQGPIPRNVTHRTQLLMTTTFPGSFGVRLIAADRSHDLFDFNLLENSIRQLESILVYPEDREEYYQLLAGIGRRSANWIERWLQELQQNGAPVRIDWGSPMTSNPNTLVLDEQRMYELITVLSESREIVQDTISVVGVLDTASLRRHAVTIVTNENRAITAYAGHELVSGLTIERAYVFILQEIVTTHVVSNDRNISWRLVEVQDLESNTVFPTVS